MDMVSLVGRELEWTGLNCEWSLDMNLSNLRHVLQRSVVNVYTYSNCAFD